MKVALDGSLLGARFSGVERSVAQLARHLPLVAGPDDQFVLFTSEAFDAYTERFHPDGFCHSPQLEVVKAPFDARSRTSRIWFQQVVLPRLVQSCGADLFHAPAYIAPALAPRPYVVTLYDLILYERPDCCTLSNRAYYRLFLPPGTRSAARVIVPSGATRRAVARYLPHLWERTVTIPLGVEPRFGQTTDGDAKIREQYRLPEHYLLWVGNVEPKKNLRVLLEALAILLRRGARPWPLVIAGQLSWGTEELRKLWLDLGLQRQVVFLGAVDDAELPAIYRGAGAFCFPSVAEGFGLPVAEAMAAGVPTLVSNSGALAETGGGAAMVLPHDSPAAWADGLERVIGDAALRETMRSQGLARAGELTWERCAEATLTTYAAALAAGEESDERAQSRFVFTRGAPTPPRHASPG